CILQGAARPRERRVSVDPAQTPSCAAPGRPRYSVIALVDGRSGRTEAVRQAELAGGIARSKSLRRSARATGVGATDARRDALPDQPFVSAPSAGRRGIMTSATRLYSNKPARRSELVHTTRKIRSCLAMDGALPSPG